MADKKIEIQKTIKQIEKLEKDINNNHKHAIELLKTNIETINIKQ